ncbi:MAG: RsmE family RNA methyltransferase [Microthrixaceae bacterium]
MSASGPPASVAAHALVESIEQPLATDELTRHLWGARRLRPGTSITITDGAGGWRLARLGSPGQLEPDGPVMAVPAPDPVTVAFAPVKGERPEWCVQKLTEVGVDRIVVLVCDHSVVRWEGSRAEGHLAKLARVAAAAVEQCRRVWLPTIVGPCSIDELTEPSADGLPRPWVRADGDGRELAGGDRAMLVGPEGGFSDRERALVADAVRLGPHVMRAETAAMVAGASAVALREHEVRAYHGEFG